MDTFTTPIVTSKAAQEHFLDVKSQHANILQGIQDQQVKVQAYNQQKQIEQEQQLQAKNQSDTERMKIQAQSTKDQMDNELKNKDLELKRLALSSE